MAGHYFYDPRPFYGVNMNSNLMPLDEVFYKYEAKPYWMDQRNMPMPMSYAELHAKQAMMTRGPDVPQFLPYMRPELAARDDIYLDAYKRAPHFAPGFEVPYPGDQRSRQMSKDDFYLPTMVPAHSQFGPPLGYGAMPTMPMGYNQPQQFNQQPGHMSNQTNGGSNNNKSSSSNNNSNSNDVDDRYGTKSSKKTSSNNNNADQYNNRQDDDHGYGSKSTSNMSKSSKQQEMYNDDYAYGNVSTKSKQDDYGHGNKSSGNSNNDYGNSAMIKNSRMKKSNDESYSNKRSNGNSSYKQKQYNDSSSDDDEWSTKPLLKQSGQKKQSGSSSKGSGGHGYGNSSNNMVVYDCGKKHIHDSYSSDEDESYAYTKKASKASAGQQYNQGATNVQQHSQQQPKQPVFLSQSKSVELKVQLCCDNCERKVTACLRNLDGVDSVLCDQWEKKVIVYGNVKPDVVLKRVRKVKKSAELWQQTPAKRVWVY